jgi:predicted type IV restriction endonuclease
MSDGQKEPFCVHHLLFGGWIIAFIAAIGLAMTTQTGLQKLVSWAIILGVTFGIVYQYYVYLKQRRRQ